MESQMSRESILSICAVMAVLIAVIGVGLALWSRKDLKRAVRCSGVCAFLMLMAGIYPYYADKSYAVGLTLAESMCAMLLNSNPGEILAGFDSFNVAYIGIYKAVLLVLLIVAPLFTVGITLSFFSERFTRLLYRLRSAFGDTYLFSAINERTLSIAEDIVKTHKKAVVVFALRALKEDFDAECLARIKEIGAYVLNDDIVHIKHSLHHTRNYYLLDTESGENLDAGLRLYQKYSGEHTDKVNMWLYSQNEISEVIFDHLYETFNVRLINEGGLIARALANDYPLYDAIEEGRLSLLVVGGGNIGLEILRTLTMCSALGDKVRVEINLIDLNGERARAVLEKTSPELAEKWNIRFHSADIKTASFASVLDGIRPTYIVVSLGSEALNMEAALYIRRKYGMKNGLPRIHALVDHKSMEEQILPNLCVTDWKYNGEKHRFDGTPVCSFAITAFGSYEDTYKDLRIGASYRDCLAVAVNAAGRGIIEVNSEITPDVLTDLYNQVCFYKDYSDAFAVSIPYKLWLLGLTLVEDGQGDLSALENALVHGADQLRKQENRRYEAFMRSKGWTQLPPSEVTDGRLSDKLMKRYARLDDRHTKTLEKMTGRNFVQEDLETVLRLPAIIRLANMLYGKLYSVRKII